MGLLGLSALLKPRGPAVDDVRRPRRADGSVVKSDEAYQPPAPQSTLHHTDQASEFVGEKRDGSVVGRFPGIPFPLSKTEAAALDELRGRFVLAEEMSPAARRVFSQAFPFATMPPPHVGGLRAPPWNMAALLDATTETNIAMALYYEPNFIHRTPEEKRAILKELAPLCAPHVAAHLEKLHLPRTMKNTSTNAIITKAIEHECVDLNKLFLFYAPDPTGALDRRAISDDLKKKLLNPMTGYCVRPRTPLESRYDDDTWIKSLRWKDLAPAAQYEYCQVVERDIDPELKMYRITDPKHAHGGVVAPDTLQKMLKWDMGKRLQIGELITDGHYVSQDVLLADRHWIQTHLGGGFHLHAVAELSSPEDKKLLGPKITALAALEDLAIFATAARSAASNYTHVFLEPWQAHDMNAVAAGFANGALPHDEIIAHKFHMTGMRTKIYGDDDSRLGIEVRGILMNEPARFDHASRRVTDLYADGTIMRLPSPPWEGWDAGDKGVPAKWEAKAREWWKDSELVKQAELGFDDVFDVVDRGAKTTNGFAFRSAMWNFEAIPGLSDEEKHRITLARFDFVAAVMQMSVVLTRAINAERDIDELAPYVFEKVVEASMKFFADAGVDAAIERVLDQCAYGRHDEP